MDEKSNKLPSVNGQSESPYCNLPCPFCGEPPVLVKEGGILFAVQCRECGQAVGKAWPEKGMAIASWNRRIDATALWNKAADLPTFHETNAVWGVLKELESMGAIFIDSAEG